MLRPCRCPPDASTTPLPCLAHKSDYTAFAQLSKRSTTTRPCKCSTLRLPHLSLGHLFSQGCFWGVEHYFNKHFKGAILKSAVGYTGGAAENPKCATNPFCVCGLVA